MVDKLYQNLLYIGITFTESLIIVGITFLLNYAASRLFRKLHQSYARRGLDWNTRVLNSLKTPIHFMIIIIGFSFAIEFLEKQMQFGIARIEGQTKSILIIITMLWFGIRFIDQMENYWYQKAKSDKENKLDKTSIGAIAKLLRISFIVIAGLICLETLGFSISGILAFGGVGGVALGFASKDLLANFFGALMIYLDQPFKVGDWVKIPEKGIEGTISRIGIRCTIIKTFEKRPLYVPNSIFTQVSIENPSRMSHRQIKEVISLRYEDINVIRELTKAIQAMLRGHESVDNNQTIYANLINCSDSSFNIEVCAYTKSIAADEYYDVKEDVLLKIAKLVEDHGAKFTSIMLVNHAG